MWMGLGGRRWPVDGRGMAAGWPEDGRGMAGGGQGLAWVGGDG